MTLNASRFINYRKDVSSIVVMFIIIPSSPSAKSGSSMTIFEYLKWCVCGMILYLEPVLYNMRGGRITGNCRIKPLIVSHVEIIISFTGGFHCSFVPTHLISI